ncbi:ABC transporter permease, partial [Streptomyces sp. NPDC001537]
MAARIHDAFPNLRVDVTVGSSPAPQTVALAAGLNVRENWTAKGVALRVLQAVDTKSAVLLVLVLAVLAVVGLGAGALGVLLAYGLGALLGLSHSFAKAALVLPVALLLALLAGLIPAWRATRISPLDAVTAPVAPARRSV